MNRCLPATTHPGRCSIEVRSDTPPRHRSLYQTIRWSHDLLDPATQVVFRRLSVLWGAWSIDVAESVCAGQGARDSLEVVDVFGGLSTLVDFHLVEPAMDSLDNPRFSLLETIRLFARERLIQAGETHQFDRRHAEFFLSIMIKAGTGFETKDERSWYAHIDRDLPDLRAALGWLHRRAG